MKKFNMITDIENLSGKTIRYAKEINLNSEIGIVFDDDSFCVFSSYKDYDGFLATSLEIKHDIDIMYELEIVSEEEYIKIIDDRIEKEEREDERKEYETYLKLKEKYEGVNKCQNS